MVTNNARLYAPIEKTEVQDDGTIKVWGYASAPTEDSDGETITAEAMKAALPDYMKFGAVREMHGKSAAGTAIEADVQDDGRTWFGAHVVDPVAVKKVQTKVYKGFSIGGRITARDDLVKTTITGLKLVEVSLVDRPANPDAVFTMYKAETELTAVETLAKMVNDGDVTPEQLVELVKASLAAPVEPEAVAVAVIDAPAHDVAEKVADAVEASTDVDATAEESAELLAAVPALDNAMPEVVQMADTAADLAKAGARNSKTDKHTIQSMHDGACALGANCGTDKADSGGDLAKVEAIAAERDEAIAKASTLAAELEALNARASNGKAILKILSKAEDIGEVEKAEDGPPEGASDNARALWAIKKSFQNPIRISN
jgi:hypothetical protein